MPQQFDEKRKDLKPYGLSCELWQPSLMRRPDRHNEIEVNFLIEGSLTYLIHDKKIKVNRNNLLVFWALVPHQIVGFDQHKPYYVITIPFAEFAGWHLPSSFTEELFQGKIKTYEATRLDYTGINVFQRWAKDLSTSFPETTEICALEIQVLLRRLALEYKTSIDQISAPVQLPMNLVEQMAIYIAENYTNPIKVRDVAHKVGLHPDYANSIFKKAFKTTISAHLAEQRTLFAKRKLSVTSESITTIAYESGFNSISRFNATFRKFSGITPRDYRKQFGN